jgi:NAD(P)-dependent dehydrogenase (short-subunit alcohol dehydrogenase family)
VNVLSPGQVDTPNSQRPDSQRLDKATRQMFESLIPRGKMGRPEEIAAAALFLASDDSSSVNGVELFVDGGFSAI